MQETKQRKILTMMLAFVIAFTFSIAMPMEGEASTNGGTTLYSGSDCTTDSAGKASIDYLMQKFKENSYYPYSGQCYGYAEKAASYIAASRKTYSYYGLKFNKTNFLKKCKGVKAGTHLRLSNSKGFNGGYGHSIVLMKVTSNMIYWADNNAGGTNNRVHYWKGTYNAFYWRYGGFKYINRVTKTTSYKSHAAPSAAAAITTAGKPVVCWLRTSGASKYYVYRSSSKNGKYSFVKSTISKKYYVQSGTPGKTYYYKIKAIRSKGNRYGNVVSATCRLGTPDVNISNNEYTGEINLTWKTIPKATKYYIFRCGGDTDTYKYYKTTTKTSFAEKRDTDGNYYSYEVRAVYGANAKGNSHRSIETSWCCATIMKPVILSAEKDSLTDEYIVKWTPDSYVSEYEVYVTPENGEEYLYGYSDDGTFSKSLKLDPGTYYIRVETREQGYALKTSDLYKLNVE